MILQQPKITMLDKIQTPRSCSKYEQMVLQVLSSEFHRTGVEESSVGAVFRFEYQYLGAFFIRWSRSKLFYFNFNSFRELSARLQIETMPVLSLPGMISWKTCCDWFWHSFRHSSCLCKTVCYEACPSWELQVTISQGFVDFIPAVFLWFLNNY